jgi:hypothetical protein
MFCLKLLKAKLMDMLYHLLCSATAVEGGSHLGDTSFEEKSIQAIFFLSQLDSQ